METDDLESLQSQWSLLYAKTLPALARAKDPVQPKWPVALDHCFARIILDNTIGQGKKQWDYIIKRPAVRNMGAAQLKEAIEMGKKIQNGQVDLVQLDQQSLEARGKGEKKYGSAAKRTREDDRGKSGAQQMSSPKKQKRDQKTQSILSFARKSDGVDGKAQLPSPGSSPDQEALSEAAASAEEDSYPNPNTPEFLTKIRNHSGLTPYRKRLYSILLSVPRGHHTTYQAMATFLDSSARAVGNGMRNNPFAPDVPCHRVLASDGSIGGFYGSWGEEGKHAAEKKQLLNDEGVKFDSRGKVKGPVFRDFEDLLQRKSILAG